MIFASLTKPQEINRILFLCLQQALVKLTFFKRRLSGNRFCRICRTLSLFDKCLRHDDRFFQRKLCILCGGGCALHHQHKFTAGCLLRLRFHGFGKGKPQDFLMNFGELPCKGNAPFAAEGHGKIL